MAKKTSANALQFVFSAAELRDILGNNPDKVVFTVSVEAAVTKQGDKVGALRINAKGHKNGKPINTRGGGGGCPIPPCSN
jgi:hypothetical protein